MKITNTLRVATYMVAIFMVSLTACKKVDTFFFNKYHLQVDENMLNGTVQYNIDGTGFRTLTTQDTVIEVNDNTTIVFQAMPNAGYQFADWGNLTADFATNNPTAPIKLTKNFVFKPTFTQTKSEYTIALGTITKVETGDGHIEYSTDNEATWATLTTTPVTFMAGTPIQFRAITTTGFFWQWDAGVSGFTENPPPITLNNDIVISATFGNYERTHVAIKDLSTNGHVEYSSNATTGFKPITLNESVPAGTTIYFKAMPDNYYKIATSGTWTISIPHTFIETSSDGLAQVSATITKEATITAKFEIIKYDITINPHTNQLNKIAYMKQEESSYTEINASTTISVDADKKLSLKATPNTSASPYYRFDQWNGLPTGVTIPPSTNGENTVAFQPTGATTISANLIQQYKIDVPALPTGANSLLVNATQYATSPGNQPTASSGAANTIYIDANTPITAIATPKIITTAGSEEYYRFDHWDGTTLTGTAANGTNTSNLFTPTTDMTIPAPTFIQQYKLDIALSTTSTSSSFTIGNGSSPYNIGYATVAGNQPSPYSDETRLKTGVLLTGFFDSGKTLAIVSTPEAGYKIRFGIAGESSAVEKWTTILMDNNKLLTGFVSSFSIADVKIDAAGNPIGIFKIPAGLFNLQSGGGDAGDRYAEKSIEFSIHQSDAKMISLTIDGHTFTFSGANPHINGNTYSYTVTPPTGSGYSNQLTFSFSIMSVGNGEIQGIKLIDLANPNRCNLIGLVKFPLYP